MRRMRSRPVAVAAILTVFVVLAAACSRGTDGPSAAGTAGGTAAGSAPAGSVPLGEATAESAEADPSASQATPPPLVLADGTTIAPGAGASPGAAASTSTSAANPTSTTTAPGPSAKIQAIIDTYIQTNGIAGVAVAVIRPGTGDQPRITPYVAGVPTIAASIPVRPATQFEMGSETKTFTAALLANLVATGRVSLTDPLQKYVPANVKVPTWTDGTQITIGNLATHQAGLPDEPANLAAGPDGKQNYTQEMLWQAIPDTKLLWQPGSSWLYSNYGWGILGTVLANLVQPGAPSAPFGPAVAQTLTTPAGMTNTLLETCNTTTCPQMPALATPYFAGNQPAPYWNNNNALAGGGGLVTTITDMGRWIADVVGYPSALSGFSSLPLKPVSTITSQCKKNPVPRGGNAVEPYTCIKPAFSFQMGMAWQLYDNTPWLAQPYAFKNGGTAGMHSTTYIVPGSRLGVTVLSNGPHPVDNLGKYIIHAIVTGAA